MTSRLDRPSSNARCVGAHSVPGANRSGGPALRPFASVIIVALSIGLSGCAEQSMDDLKLYVKDVMARPGKPPEPLPPIEPYEIYTYSSSEGIDPFQPFFVAPPEVTDSKADQGNGLKPDVNRNREELEAHPLDALRMMGTLERDGETWGIVRAPDAVIHRIKVGNYLGQNHGKIIEISEEQIGLSEIVPDGQGGWVERDASLALFQ